jgi:hypothetical protein
LPTFFKKLHINIPAVYDVLTTRMSLPAASGGVLNLTANKQMRSICMVDKMCRSNGVGMFANEVGVRSKTRDVAEAEPPAGDVPSIAGARKQVRYVQFLTQ